MKSKPYLSIVIPAFNEARRVSVTLTDINQRMNKYDFAYEIIVINDGSQDDTAALVRKLCPLIRNLRLVDNDLNQGKGAAVRQGMLLAEGDVRLFTDADNATTIDHFERMIPLFRDGYDVVICDRALEGSKLDPPKAWYHRIAAKAGNLFIQMLVLPGIWDTECGFKAFTERATQGIFSLSEINGWGFDVEILSLAKALGYQIGEVPVHWVAVGGGQLRLWAYLQVLVETVKIRARLWTNHYLLVPQGVRCMQK